MKKFAKMAVAAAIAGMAMIAQATIVIDDFSVDQGTDGLGDILLRLFAFEQIFCILKASRPPKTKAKRVSYMFKEISKQIYT